MDAGRTADDWICIGDEQQDAGNLLGALSSFSNASALDPLDVEAWTSRGVVNGKLGRLEEAASCYQQALECEPDDEDLWIYHGNALLLAGRPRQALRSYRTATQLVPHISGAWMSRGYANLELGCNSEAISDFAHVIELATSQDEPGVADDGRQNWVLASSILCWESQTCCDTAPTSPRVLQPYRVCTIPDSNAYDWNPLHNLYCCHWLDASTCAALVRMAEVHVAQKGGWPRSRHKNHPTLDIEVSQVDGLKCWMQPRLHAAIIPTMSRLFELDEEQMRVQEIFLVKYCSRAGHQSSLGLHRDGHLLSFNVLLSDPSAFEGGGTHMPALEEGTIHLQQAGDVLFHSGQMLHAGSAVTVGTRYILVGFVRVCNMGETCFSKHLPDPPEGEEQLCDSESSCETIPHEQDYKTLDQYWQMLHES